MSQRNSRRRQQRREFYLVDNTVGRNFGVVGSGRPPTLDEVPQLVAEMRQVPAAKTQEKRKQKEKKEELNYK